MSVIRRIRRILLLIGWSMLSIVLSSPFQFRRGTAGARSMSGWVRRWHSGVAWIVNLRVRMIGAPPAFPAGLVVSNHLSYVDIVVHGSLFRIRSVAKREIAHWPVLGWFLGLGRPIWTDRQSRQKSKDSLGEYTDTMRDGMCLLVYPEGTTSDGVSGVLPFKSTPFEAAIVGNAPVLPIVTRYRGEAGALVPWYGDMTLLPHLWRILGLPQIDAEVYFLPPVHPEGRDRKELARAVREKITAAYHHP